MTSTSRPTLARAVDRSMVAVAVVALTGVLLLTGMAYFGSLWWAFDLTANFRVQYMLALAPLASLLWALDRRRWAIVAVVGMLINAAYIAPLYLSSPAPAAVGAPELKILSLNMRATNPDQEEVIDFLRGADADVVFLSEYSRRWVGVLENADLPFEIVARPPDTSPFGVVALTRVEAEGDIVRIGSTRLPAAVLTVPLGDQRITVVGFHTTSPGSRITAEWRDDQLAALARLAGESANPVVVVGDLNVTPWSHAFTVLEDAGLVNSQMGYGLQASWPSGWGPLMIPIDHALHSPELTTVDRFNGSAAGSDHLSLFVTVAPREVGGR